MLYGAQYYRPPFPGRACWRRDLAHMKELGFNCVKHWAVWNWIEWEPGCFDFSELDELVALSREYGLQVVINTVPEGAPYWTYEGNEEDLYRTADGQRVAYGGTGQPAQRRLAGAVYGQAGVCGARGGVYRGDGAAFCQ